MSRFSTFVRTRIGPHVEVLLLVAAAGLVVASVQGQGVTVTSLLMIGVLFLWAAQGRRISLLDLRVAEVERTLAAMLELHESAVRYWTRTRGPLSEEAAGSVHRLGLLHNALGRQDEAEASYRRALHLWERLQGAESEAVAGCLSNLATLLDATGRYAEAEPLHERAIAIREKVLGQNHPEVAVALSNLASHYWRQEEYARAEALYPRLIAIWEQTPDVEPDALADALENHATLLELLSRPAEAAEAAARAVALRPAARA